jgi:hypothetical protein
MALRGKNLGSDTLAAGLLASVVCAGAAFSAPNNAASVSADAASAEGGAAVLDLAPSPNVGWIAYGTDFLSPPSGPGPVLSDPKHPFIPNRVEYAQAQPDLTIEGPSTFRVADLSNPILQPSTREALRKANERVLAGKPSYTRQTACWPLGVPAYLLYPVQPVFFVQTAKQVVMITQFDHMIRHVYLNMPHSRRVKPSWHGESVGRYEGTTLVVDTIGMNDQTYVDNYRTPHTDKLHVVERFHLIDAGKTLQVDVHVEDPRAFTAAWNAVQRYRRVEPGPILEMNCAENNPNYFDYDVEPMPQAKTPDF